MDEIVFHPIGLIRSEHQEPGKTPIQPVFAEGCAGTVELFPAYAAGLEGLGEFTHIYLLYALHRQTEARLRVKPFMGDHETGIFATRHPARPNPLGISLVALRAIEGNVLRIGGCDILDQTPLIDIKPYIPRFDHISDASGGWTSVIDDQTARERGKRDYGR